MSFSNAEYRKKTDNLRKFFYFPFLSINQAVMRLDIRQQRYINNYEFNYILH